MKCLIKIKPQETLRIVLPGLVLSILLLTGCATVTPGVRIYQYQFELDNEIYRIRSIDSADDDLASNELIGSSILAVDFDQDGVLDQITVGEKDLHEVQQIYEHGINDLSQKNKIQERNPQNHRFIVESQGFLLEIKSFRPENAPPFNEFKIHRRYVKQNQVVAVAIDQNADGILDQRIKGTQRLEDIQAQYSMAIDAGLRQETLRKTDSRILVIKK